MKTNLRNSQMKTFRPTTSSSFELSSFVEELPIENRVVVAARFGLLNHDRTGRSVKQLSAMFNVTKREVEEIIDVSLDVLHQRVLGQPIKAVVTNSRLTAIAQKLVIA